MKKKSQIVYLLNQSTSDPNSTIMKIILIRETTHSFENFPCLYRFCSHILVKKTEDRCYYIFLNIPFLITIFLL